MPRNISPELQQLLSRAIVRKMNLGPILQDWKIKHHAKRLNLRYAVLDRCIYRADLRGVNLREANLEGAQLRHDYLSHADLSGADFRGATLIDVNFTGANLRGADFRGARLDDADFTEADLRGADFRGARLDDADFTEADIRGADLKNANLVGALFYDTKLAGANLQGAKIDTCCHAIVIHIILSSSAPRSVKRWAKTNLPDANWANMSSYLLQEDNEKTLIKILKIFRTWPDLWAMAITYINEEQALKLIG